MARTLAALLAAALLGGASGLLTGRLAANATFTVNDRVYVDGSLFAESAAIGDNLGCTEHKGTSSFKVCGCGVKVVAHLMTECQTYKQYDTQIGHCNCANSGCDEKVLQSGYTSQFNWQAASFEVTAC
eukprot:CAMPEP_0203970254 /NCGR_PEP_ID=MMETSP0359-20131031/97873_1 /ASSEMBLY_ACC=CAM_ASM_000338 /TAXON_ID=268821 /ORGANISM="Scrippsiella Hangoei, Strain SHTV-5" /LENGTH=127 /DNA_ID=CAMNT_0050908205 /DNA_START=69 /DNA_END=452 /DNA_ORIENTATION=-